MRTRHLVPALALIAAAPLAAQGLPSPSPSTTRPDSAGGMSSGSSWQQDTTRTKAKKDSASRLGRWPVEERLGDEAPAGGGCAGVAEARLTSYRGQVPPMRGHLPAPTAS
ncbi:MAG: hypothetical protein MUF21_04930 [Gemmatimonadaceae bacterium]|nr:hypothetical protein [Gemmatimonadaceae bacterium]